MLALPETLKSVYLKITLSRFTVAFFLFAFIHSFAEGFIQAFIFSQDAYANNIVTSILREAQVPRANFGILHRAHGNATLSLCNEIPTYISEKPCALVYETGRNNLTDPSFTTTAVNVSVPLGDGSSKQISSMCALVLTYPHQVLANAQREDVVLLLTQFWIFSVSFFAIVYDSIPHLVAALCFRTLATGWSMYIIWRTGDVRERFEILLHSNDSPCRFEVDQLFPSYFASRSALQIPDLALNVIALLLALYLSRKLIKIYGLNTFNRVGAPPEIIRVYKYFLGVFVSFQLSALLLISAVALWLDQIVNPNNAFSQMTIHKTLYIGISVTTLALLVPWIAMGWYSVRREWKKLMFAFLFIAALVFTSWILMLKSWTFAWTFVEWPFFACSIIAASLSLLATIVFGVISLLHFDKGLAHYLYVDDVLAKAGFEPELFEKDVEKNAGSDWRDIGLDDVPTYTLSFSTEKRDLGDAEKADMK
ncbi:hypothetical protein R3P38DRAFT_3313235 [Favolaschia claudopus]|uniref:Uncharacterized protein n=1 Tax=Favolaschia claudopus TaxID=2862362 RepID=A0AAW0C3I9_9AGAR